MAPKERAARAEDKHPRRHLRQAAATAAQLRNDAAAMVAAHYAANPRPLAPPAPSHSLTPASGPEGG